MAVEIPFYACSGDMSTCAAATQCATGARFYEIIRDERSAMDSDHQGLMEDLLLACELGTCPGRNLEGTISALRVLMRGVCEDSIE